MQQNGFYHIHQQQEAFKCKYKELQEKGKRQSQIIKELVKHDIHKTAVQLKSPFLNTIKTVKNSDKKRYKCEIYLDKLQRQKFLKGQDYGDIDLQKNQVVKLMQQCDFNKQEDKQMEYFKSEEYRQHLQRIAQITCRQGKDSSVQQNKDHLINLKHRNMKTNKETKISRNKIEQGRQKVANKIKAETLIEQQYLNFQQQRFIEEQNPKIQTKRIKQLQKTFQRYQPSQKSWKKEQTRKFNRQKTQIQLQNPVPSQKQYEHKGIDKKRSLSLVKCLQLCINQNTKDQIHSQNKQKEIKKHTLKLELHSNKSINIQPTKSTLFQKEINQQKRSYVFDQRKPLKQCIPSNHHHLQGISQFKIFQRNQNIKQPHLAAQKNNAFSINYKIPFNKKENVKNRHRETQISYENIVKQRTNQQYKIDYRLKSPCFRHSNIPTSFYHNQIQQNKQKSIRKHKGNQQNMDLYIKQQKYPSKNNFFQPKISHQKVYAQIQNMYYHYSPKLQKDQCSKTPKTKYQFKIKQQQPIIKTARTQFKNINRQNVPITKVKSKMSIVSKSQTFNQR